MPFSLRKLSLFFSAWEFKNKSVAFALNSIYDNIAKIAIVDNCHKPSVKSGKYDKTPTVRKANPNQKKTKVKTSASIAISPIPIAIRIVGEIKLRVKLSITQSFK